MATFVIVPCHFMGGSAWARVQPLLEEAGHEMFALDLRGWGTRRTMLGPQIGLGAHIDDVVQVLESGDLRDVILVGHSYGGAVVAGVAAQVPQRLAHLVLLDAPVPHHGDTIFDHLPDEVVSWYRDQASTASDGWRVPPPDLAYHRLGDADIAWLTPMVGPVPLLTCEEPLNAPGDPLLTMPRTYVWCREYPLFAETAARIRGDPDWAYFELTSGHLPMVTNPVETAGLLATIARTEK